MSFFSFPNQSCSFYFLNKSYLNYIKQGREHRENLLQVSEMLLSLSLSSLSFPLITNLSSSEIYLIPDIFQDRIPRLSPLAVEPNHQTHFEVHLRHQLNWESKMLKAYEQKPSTITVLCK